MKERDNFLGKISYAFGDIYGGGSFLIMGMLFLAFLTNVEGLPGSWAGAVVFVGKAWDAVTDPLMGILSDKTKSRYGRRRLYFIIGAVPVFISWVTLWYSFGITGEAAKIVYYMLSYMLFSTAFTIVMVPYNAILADMTSDYNKRSAFTGMRLSFSAGAAIICGIIPNMITGSFTTQQTGYLVMALIFGAVFGASWLPVFFGTWENTKSVSKAGFTFREWYSVFKNRSFRLYAMIFVFSQLAIDTAMAVAVYFLSVTLQKSSLYTVAMGSILAVQLIFVIIFSKAAQKFGKKIPGIISSAVWIAAGIIIFTFTPQTPDMLIVPVCALIGVGAAGCNLVSWSILPDICDVDELITGKRREGLYSGVSTFLRKLSSGIMVGVTGVMLDIFHYSKDAVDAGNIEPLTITGIKILFCVVPILFLAAMLLVLRKYRLGRKEFSVMHEVIAAYRKDGTNIELNSEQEAVCRQITGIDKNNFFGTDN